ncbi:MAG TPA: M48 family metallopeptidase [Rhodocyclaceae bacterium]|nr:M48 family metallopeptidase [Rhodocyclaceae bacterium]
MAATPPLRKDLTRIVVTALVSLFLVPLCTYLFVAYALPRQDADILAAIERQVDQDRRLDEQGRLGNKLFFRNIPASRTCGNPSPELASYREAVCPQYSPLWQFHMVKKVSGAALLAGVLLLAAISALGFAAFANRRAQYLSFVLGWRLLTVASAAEVVVQGSLLVWLSFWVTAYFFHVYILKLILLFGIAAALGIFYAIVCIFKRAPRDTGVEGTVVGKSSAPALWAHVGAMAKAVGTAPPDHIVAGIDTNFFVTEAPLRVGQQTLKGRSLFISLPLLRLLDRGEADAVLAHELAHFGAGDTASNAALGPKLTQYDYYCAMMASAGLTLLAFCLLRLYRVIFEFALKRDSRAREFLADKVAAAQVSAQAIITALIKVGAYAKYRNQIEEGLFAQSEKHSESIGIARRIADGLAPYAASAQFLDAMGSVDMPHPFDSHPPLSERMLNVAHRVRLQDYPGIVSGTPDATWVADIEDADGIEERLWNAYENRFAAAHEQNLAYRYRPANEEERAIVLKYFPPLVFPLRGAKQVEISYEGLVLPKAPELLSWDSVANLKYEDGYGGDVLEIVHPEKGWFGSKTTKVKLPGIRKQRDNFKAALGHYWQRHQIMRKIAGGEAAEG